MTREGKDTMIDYRNVLTTCPYCGTGCNFHLEVLNGELVGVTPAKTHVISQGRLCIKGWNAHAFVNHPDRLTSPLIRKNGELQPATWDEAYQLVADRFAEIKATSGPDSIGFFTSSRCTNEENYLMQKLSRAVIGTNNVDNCARL